MMLEKYTTIAIVGVICLVGAMVVMKCNPLSWMCCKKKWCCTKNSTCAPKEKEKEESMIKQITAESLKAKIEDSDEQIRLINVLDQEYYQDCHIKGSENIPLAELEEKAAQWDKDEQIVVYCARYECSASRDAAQKLQSLGFSKVMAYEGGTKEWLSKGYDVQGPCQKEYLDSSK